jgi:hypothetical protein
VIVFEFRPDFFSERQGIKESQSEDEAGASAIRATGTLPSSGDLAAGETSDEPAR